MTTEAKAANGITLQLSLGKTRIGQAALVGSILGALGLGGGYGVGAFTGGGSEAPPPSKIEHHVMEVGIAQNKTAIEECDENVESLKMTMTEEIRPAIRDLSVSTAMICDHFDLPCPVDNPNSKKHR